MITVDKEKYYTISEAATILNIGSTGVRETAKNKNMELMKQGGIYYISASQIQRLARKREG